VSICILGASGRLGRALTQEFDAPLCPDRTVYAGWAADGAAGSVTRYFEGLQKRPEAVLVASGLLDPRLPADDLTAVNYRLPRNVVEGVSGLGIRVLTFGTVTEALPVTNNPYIESKSALGAYIERVAAEGLPVVHVRLHTLYGVGAPSPFMFLGQMLSAILRNARFEMTSGRQLREYHHVLDDAMATRLLCRSKTTGVVNLGHGKPLQLRSLAEHVFEAVGKSYLLALGALPDPPAENYSLTLGVPDMLEQIEFRDTLSAVTEYVRSCLASSEA
jgi:nucleoside-diphosphate-sugar epimerase